MNQTLFGEKRAHERVPLRLPIRYRVLDEQVTARNVSEFAKSENLTQTLDTSLGGLCVSQDGQLKAGNLLNVKLTLPGHNEVITAFADVVWVKEFLAGLKFLAVKKQDLDLLTQQIKKVPAA